MAHPSLIDKQAAVRPDMATLSSSLPMSFSLPSREIRFKPAIPAVRVCPATSRKNCSESMVCGGGGATPPNAMSIMAPISRSSASDSIVCPVPRKIHPITVAAPLEAPILYRSPHRRVQIPPVVPSWLHSNSPSTHHGRRPSYSHEHGESVNTTTGLSGVFDAVHVPTVHSVTLMKDPVMLAQRELGEILGL
ncbi:hypothetical protein BSLG_004934 [Batrachochytrium salamandrivorans]|nr:hypothetical protein BSLG_004934 [Batrachochytrium salamandrivorans]